MGAGTLQRERQLNRFFAEVERRALRIAEIAVRDRDEALDLVQDAMIKLARRYAEKPADQWTPLFYRILQNGVRDWHRRQNVRRRVMVWFGRASQEDNDWDPVADNKRDGFAAGGAWGQRLFFNLDGKRAG